MGKGRVAHGFTLLDQAVTAWNTHFLDGRIHPCLAEVWDCLPCRQGFTPRWRGFVAARKAGSGGRYVLQVTAAAYRECEELRRLDGRLRGSCWSVWRAGETRQSRWCWKFAAHPGEANLPAGGFVVRVMSNVWGIDLLKLHQVPPADGDCRPLMSPYNRVYRRGRP
jgi:hypothetical protein